MNNQSKKLLMFDLDGTLVDSVPDIAIAANKMLRTFDRKPFAVEDYRAWIGNGATKMVDRALSAGIEVDPHLSAEFRATALDRFLTEYSKASCVETCLYDDVQPTLSFLKKQGDTIAVITNKPQIFIDPILKHLGIAEFVDFSLGGDALHEKKPSPRPLLYTCEKLGFNVKNAIMIGDSENDIRAAHRANIKSIGLSYGYNYGQSISVENPTYVFDSFKEILTVLARE